MLSRTLWFFAALSSFAAQAQAAEEPLAPPPMVSSEPEPACATCANGAQCVQGRCQYTCATDRDCRRGLVCVPLEGTVSGVCERKPPQRTNAPRMISPADASHPERYRNSRVVPPGFHVVQEPMWGVVAGGIGAFAIGYLPFAIFGPLGGRPWLAIPFVGPIVNYRPSGGWFGGTIDFLHIVGIVIDVAVQVAGIGAIIGGAVARKRWLERDAQQPRISFAPGAAGSPLGASIVGTF